MSVAKTGQEWGAGGRQGQTPFGLGLDPSEEMRRGMMWRMLAFPAGVAEAALCGCSARPTAPAWPARWVGRLFARLLGSRGGSSPQGGTRGDGSMVVGARSEKTEAEAGGWEGAAARGGAGGGGGGEPGAGGGEARSYGRTRGIT
ncbi:hypothetical protein ZWY2020_016060 [Hordeum vulgare]|nr:hypothetical protein ZWY2020_016060 [Hordeum vulgare]